MWAGTEPAPTVGAASVRALCFVKETEAKCLGYKKFKPMEAAR